jgi:stearoyl-CoA desaturase (delta-9 desaturase)
MAEQPRPARNFSSLITVTAFLAMHLAAFSIFFVEFYWWAPVMAVVLYVIRGFGITAGYHRYFAHRAFKTSRWFQFMLGVFGAAALQRGPIWWAGHHRTHHKFSDEPEDPHSPIVGSIWWSHIGWVISNRFNTTEWDLMKDFKKYPEIKLLERFDLVPGVLLGVACAAFGGLTGLCWFFASTVALYHGTFMVNSVCHLMGRRRFATKDHSRNNWFVAFLTLGEGWHNNHHHYPSSARQGFKWWEYDFSYWVLKALSWVGVVWDLREPTPRALAAKLNG